MSTGKKYVISFHVEAGPTPVIDNIDLSGTFTYNGTYTSNVVVKKDDLANTDLDRYIVTYYWAAGEAPALTTTLAGMLSDAVSQVNTVLPGEIVLLS